MSDSKTTRPVAGTADIIPLGKIVSRVGRVEGMRITGKLLNVLNEVAEQGVKAGGLQELIHAVHLKKFKEEWVAANRPGDLQHYVAARQREAFAAMRKTIEGASGKDREVMLRTIMQSYDVYFRNFKEEITANPSEKDILAFIESKGHSPTFMNEFMRQIVQLSEQGNTAVDDQRWLVVDGERLLLWDGELSDWEEWGVFSAELQSFSEKGEEILRRLYAEIDWRKTATR
ncbi:hypothetical protein DB345_02805 [Spartobacteria bacterium LR76]|nr:hypothetical protein DB345_02805 [Spartobacteria bacterium LR76]